MRADSPRAGSSRNQARGSSESLLRVHLAATGGPQHAGAVVPRGRPRVLIVSNRLPWTVDPHAEGARLRRSSGGLATGLGGVHARSGGLWIGWPGAAAAPGDERIDVTRELRSAGAIPVSLRADEVAGFYRRFSNEMLWPVLHGYPPRGDAGDWPTYRAVNERYAAVIAAHMRPGDRVWIHDYHLMLVPGLLRRLRPDARIGFFLHTPFPAANVLGLVPPAPALLRGLLGADVIGFHTRDYVSAFREALASILDVKSTADHVGWGHRDVGLMACPIGVDVVAFERLARSSDVATRVAELRARVSGPVFVGVDRLDYTKGIPERLLAFERLLEDRPDLRGTARLIQIAVPSREDASGYREVRAEVEAIVTRINVRFGARGETPVEYTYGSVSQVELVALYRAADVMVVTPLCDGMNLVSKEFVASRTDEEGVLILGEAAGAAVELREALRVDPRDVTALASAYQAALAMTPAERRVRMRRLRRAVRGSDVFTWADRFINAIGGR